MALDEMPKGFRGTATSTPSKAAEESEQLQHQADPSIMEIVSNMPGTLYDAATGDATPIEFPFLPELTDMGQDSPGFIEGLVVNAQIIFSRDDLGKAEVIHRTFEGDSRYGGRYADKYGHPIIVWNEVPYYVNKPGLSEQDFGTFFGEVLRYTPASKFASKGKTVVGTVSRGLPAYATTEAATIAQENLLTPEATKAKNRSFAEVGSDIGTSAAIGSTTDVVLPVITRGASTVLSPVVKAAGKATEKVAETVLPRFNMDAWRGQRAQLSPDEVQTSVYPLTEGQRTTKPPMGVTLRQSEQIGQEERLRRMASSAPGTQMIRGFDEAQLDAIRRDALALQEEFSQVPSGVVGPYSNIPSYAAESAQEVTERAAGRLKEESSTLYDAVQQVETPPVMTAEGVQEVAQELLDVVPSLGISPSQIVSGPLMREITQLRRLKNLAKNPKFKDQPLKNIHGYQKRLRTAIGQAEKGSPDELALIRMKQVLDESLYGGIERGIISGDQEVIDQLRQATEVYRDYMVATGRGVGRTPQERTANTVLHKLSDHDYTPPQVANLLFGHGLFSPNQSMGLVIDRLKTALDPAEFEEFVNLLKAGIMTKAFAGKGELSRTAIVKNYNGVFNEQRDIINRVFSPDEIKQIDAFRTNVLPTLWAEHNSNPSGTSWSMLSAALRGSMPFFSFAPGIRALGNVAADVAESGAAQDFAKDALSQTVRRMQTPMLSAGTQGAIRSFLASEEDVGAAASDGRERERLEEAVGRVQQDMEKEEQAPPAVPAAPPAAPPQAQNFSPLPQLQSPGPGGGFTSLNPAMSPTILPSAEDRELAMRQ